jgi:hypothetical protein
MIGRKVRTLNRVKKEELKRYRAARNGLTPEEVAELDAREAAEKLFAKEVEEIHRRLFPEEYDFFYDDLVDATRRAQGVNPMSNEYVERTDARRAALGFAGYIKRSESGSGSLGWVRSMLREGKQAELERICQSSEDMEAQPQTRK